MCLNFKMIGAGHETQDLWNRIQTRHLMTFGIHSGFKDLDVGLTTILT